VNSRKPTKDPKRLAVQKTRRSPVIISHLVLVCAGMILMFLVQFLLPERFRWFHEAGSADASPAYQNSGHRSLAHPWGDLQYMPIALSRPDAYFTNMPAPPDKTRWFLGLPAWPKVAEFIESLPVEARARSFLSQSSNWEKLPAGFATFPPADVVLAISPTARARLYNHLAQFEQNEAQRAPFRLEGGADWFNESGLDDDKITLARKLVYTNEETVCFADLGAFGQLSTREDAGRLRKTLSRVPTYMIKVHIDPESDLDSLLKYWAAFGNARDAKILFRSLSRADSDVNISYFLPSFPRLRLYTYPRPEEPQAAEQDDIWTAMNFFNEKPDQRFLDDAYAERILITDYARISTKDKRFGDLIAFVTGNKIKRMSVYLADDFVFTKSGQGPFEPWLVKRIKDIITALQPERPFEIRVFRARNKPTFAAHELLNSAVLD